MFDLANRPCSATSNRHKCHTQVPQLALNTEKIIERLLFILSILLYHNFYDKILCIVNDRIYGAGAVVVEVGVAKFCFFLRMVDYRSMFGSSGVHISAFRLRNI